MATAASKQLHDRLLEEMPEGASHDAASCALCAMHTEDGGPSARPDAGGDMTTFTEEQVAAAIEEATAPLLSRVSELEGMTKVAEIDAAVASARKPLEDDLASVRAELDTKVVELQTEKDRADGLVAWLEAEAVAAEEAAVLTQRKTERIAAAKEIVDFGDEYLAANSDRWAQMDDEAWASTLDSWRAIAAKSGTTGGEGPPAHTDLTLGAGRETASARPGMSAIREVMALRQQGVDPRTLSSLNR